MINNIYNLKKDVICEPEEFYDSDSHRNLYDLLARYAISKGFTPKSLNVHGLLRFYLDELGLNEPLKSPKKWLFQIARLIERNQHKSFDLRDM